MITLPFRRKKEEKITKPREEKKEIKEGEFKEKQLPASKKRKSIIKKEIGKSNIAYKVLKSPLISEKITMLEEKGKYVFKVFKNANKKEIKRAIEDLYKIKVEKVNIVNIKRKRKRLGKTEGWKPGYKKAIINLKKGEKIETLSR